jgi:hypothetical protein
MKVILLHSENRYVSTTHVAIFRVVEQEHKHIYNLSGSLHY